MRRASRCSSRPATRCTTSCARTSRSRRRPARRSRQDNRLRWHPTAGGLSTLHGEGKISVIPAIGYVEQRRVALHVAPLLGGRRDRRDAADRLARPLPRPRRARPTTRCRGSRSTSRSSRRSRRRRCRSRRSRPPTSTRSRRPGLPAHPLEASMLQEAANIGAAHATSSDAGPRDRRVDRARVAPPLQRARRVQVRLQLERSSTRPRPTRSRTGSPALAAMIAAGLPLRVVTITSPGHFDTHATQAAALNSGLQLTSDSLLAFQRDLEARGVADRVLIYVWSEFGRRAAGERLGRDRPRLGRHRLPDRHEGERPADRRVPRRHRRPQQPRQPAAHGRLPGGLRRDARAVARAPTRTPSFRTRPATSVRSCSSEDRGCRGVRGRRGARAGAGGGEDVQDVPDPRAGDGEGVLVRALEPQREVRARR